MLSARCGFLQCPRVRDIADAAHHGLSGVLPERTHAGSYHRTHSGSHRRRRGPGVSAWGTEGFIACRAEDPDLPASARGESVLSQDFQCAETSAGPSGASTSHFFILEARMELDLHSQERKG